jgi:uncharacterized damage-inducible protein DinB
MSQATHLARQFEAALLQLKNEINSYSRPALVWQLHGEIKNSGGTLCLHLLGNLNHFIGAILGNSGYVRNREAEFADRNVPVGKMIKEIDELIYRINTILEQMTDEQLAAAYPLDDGKIWKTNGARLFQLLSHLNYHLGQVNYHRRILSAALSLSEGVAQLDASSGSISKKLMR